MSISENQTLAQDYRIIEQAIQYLNNHVTEQPPLAEVAAAVGLSEFHFQRLFTRWAGISPKRFLQFLTKQNAKKLLERNSVLSATFGVGLSSPGRLHDLLVSTEALTPGEIRSRGEGVIIHWALEDSPFGEVLVGLTERGICHLAFVDDSAQEALIALSQEWPRATLKKAEGEPARIAASIFHSKKRTSPLPLHLSGTNFQLKVWEGLLKIPEGQIATYDALAEGIGHLGASRAVGTALGSNPVAVLVPCHRVIRKVGGFGNYRYGENRKKAILAWEMAHTNA